MRKAYPIAITRFLLVRSGTLVGVARVRLPPFGITLPDVEIHERAGRLSAELPADPVRAPCFDPPDRPDALSAAVLAALPVFFAGRRG